MARYKLEDIFDLQMGKTPSRNNPEYWDSCDNKWISIGDLTQAGKYVTDTKEYISDLAVEESGIKLIPANTVVMSFKLSIGKTAITSGEMYSNEAIMAFHDKHVVELIPEYIYYMFKYKNWDEGTNKAVMGKTLNKATLSKVEIEVCPFEKQKEIVELLDKVSAILEERNDELQKLDDLIKARFVEMFGSYPENEKGWETGTIRDLVTDVRYGSSRKAAEGNQGKYRYLRMNNITYSGELDLTDVKTIDIPDQELDKCVVRKGDLLFNRTNSKELVGKTCVYDRDEQMVLAGFVIRVRLNDRALPEFVSAFLNTDFSKAMLFAKCKAAVGQANINAQEFQNIGIYVPPIEFQKEFVSFKKQVDKSKVAAQIFIEEAEKI